MPETDDPGKSGTLPPPELNPLLNPVLHNNLDRWAEVYFTNPPEKRDEAVIRLLRELQDYHLAERAPRHDPLNAAPASAIQEQFQAGADALPGARRKVCQACGFVTRPYQRFCGRCGTRLSQVASEIAADGHDEAVSDLFDPEQRRPDSSVSRLEDKGSDTVARDSEIAPRFGYVVDEDAAPTRYSHRLVIGAVFALLIGALAYFAWHSGQPNSAAGGLPQEVPQVAAVPKAGPAPAPVQEQSNADTPAPEPMQTTKAGQKAMAQTPASANAPLESDASAANSELAAAAISRTPAAAPVNGATELVTAEKLLNDSGGTADDSSQAAEWLWKSVEKKNTSAMVTLAGLYLRGNGVPKSCDQGRVLLDAAATKGKKEAAVLLRNLRAFGCE